MYFPFALMLPLLLLIPSCKKDGPIKGDDDKPITPINVELKDAQIALPAGVSYDLAGHELLAFGAVQPVGKDGGSKVADVPGNINIAYVLDADNEPVLAGFITDTSSTLSVESTAKVLLYYASGTVFQPDTIKGVFINRVHELEGAAEWITQFTELWKNNPKLLSTELYKSTLSTAVGALFPKLEPTDIKKVATTGRATDLLVDDGDIRSGIQLDVAELSKLTIKNNYRRRAHAFLYKTKFKPLKGKGFETILASISGSTAADIDIHIDATSGASGVTGTISKQIQGKAMEFAVTDNGPVNLELLDNEEEAIYAVRVVGVGLADSDGNREMTDAEAKKRDRLVVETFALDYLFPAIGMGIAGMNDELKGRFVDATDQFLKYAPDIYDSLNKGDFDWAIMSTLTLFVTEVGYEALKSLIVSAYAVSLDDAEEVAEKVAKVLLRFDIALQFIDWSRITAHIKASKPLEKWEVTVRASQVSLLPKKPVIIPYSQQELVAEVKNIDESNTKGLKFKWHIAGKFGYLIDGEGNRGNSFENTSKKVFYNCNVPTTSLTGDDNYEDVFVEAYLDGQLLGRDSTTINIRKHAYRLMPNGITLTGKNYSANYAVDENQTLSSPTSIKLYLEPVNADIPAIGPGSERNYKIVWSTTGKHGGLSSGALKTATVYNENTMVYECTDDNTRQGSETVTARVYSREKGDESAAFILIAELNVTIRINNDPKTRIVHLPVQYLFGEKLDGPFIGTYNREYYSYGSYEYVGAKFKQQPDDDHYSITFYVGGSTDSGSWKVGTPYNNDIGYGDAAKFFDGTTYTWGSSFGGSSGAYYYPWLENATKPSRTPTAGVPEGVAVLTVTLK